jgi:integrase
VWGGRPVGSITRQDCVALLDGLKGFKDARRKGKTRLSHFFGWTMDRNATVTVNPAAGIQTVTAASRERALSDDELRAVWLACDQVGNFGAMVRTMILTLARRTEVAEMTDDELTESLWELPGERTKNGRPMDIHRTAALNDVLASVKRSVGCAFVFEGRHFNRPIGGFSDWKDKLDAITGKSVAPWTLHDLRRTGTSLMQRLGIAFEVREACCNHTIKGVAGTYNRYAYAAEKRRAFDALAAEIARIVSGVNLSNVVSLNQPAA